MRHASLFDAATECAQPSSALYALRCVHAMAAHVRPRRINEPTETHADASNRTSKKRRRDAGTGIPA